MVGNDQVNAQSLGCFGSGKGTNPGIDTDDELRACSSGTFNHITAQVVTFANAVRHMKIRTSATKFNRRLQDDNRGGAVDVVVAVNQNRLFAIKRRLQPIESSFHSGQKIWRMQLIE